MNVAGQTNITIVGMGLIGASLGAALRASEGWYVTGFDSDAETCEIGLDLGCADRCCADVESAVIDADVIVLATPVRTIVHYLQRLAELAPDGSTIIDLGSTKRSICAAMNQLPSRVNAIGGHPMAGKSTSGVAGSSSDLFRERKFVVVENERTDDVARTRAARIVQNIGAQAVYLDAESHDKLVAMISHVPHFLSVPLLLATEDMQDERLWALAAGGFKGATAHAADNPKMWDDIGTSNGDLISEALRTISQKIEELADTMEAGSEEELTQLLSRAFEIFNNKLA